MAILEDELREAAEVGRLVSELPEAAQRVPLRRRVGWSRKRLAAFLGIAPVTLRRFEEGALPRALTQTDALPRAVVFYKRAGGSK